MESSSKDLKENLRRLEEELAERKGALPRHSIRPHQLLEIEELEAEIAALQAQLAQAEN